MFTHHEKFTGHSNAFVFRVFSFLPERPLKTLFTVGCARTDVLLTVFEMQSASHGHNFTCHLNSRLIAVSTCPRYLHLSFLLTAGLELVSLHTTMVSYLPPFQRLQFLIMKKLISLKFEGWEGMAESSFNFQSVLTLNNSTLKLSY